jgi:hypothetical protein
MDRPSNVDRVGAPPTYVVKSRVWRAHAGARVLATGVFGGMVALAGALSGWLPALPAGLVLVGVGLVWSRADWRARLVADASGVRCFGPRGGDLPVVPWASMIRVTAGVVDLPEAVDFLEDAESRPPWVIYAELHDGSTVPFWVTAERHADPLADLPARVKRHASRLEAMRSASTAGAARGEV